MNYIQHYTSLSVVLLQVVDADCLLSAYQFGTAAAAADPTDTPVI